MEPVSLIAAATIVIAVLLSRPVRRWVWWRVARLEARSRRPGRLVCPVCIRNLRSSAAFCRYCHTPVSGYAATGPIEYIAAQGEMYRRAVSRPTHLTLIGLWLLVAPGLFMVGLAFADGPGKLAPETLIEVIVLLLPVAIAVKATGRIRRSVPPRLN